MNPTEKLNKIAEIYGLNDSIHAGHNLDGAIIDMDCTGIMDNICRKTLIRVYIQLRNIENILKNYD